MKHKIHINKHVIAQNHKNGTNEPAITCKNYKENEYGHVVTIYDQQGNAVARVVQAGGDIKPLSCGAKVYIETEHPVEVYRREDESITK